MTGDRELATCRTPTATPGCLMIRALRVLLLFSDQRATDGASILVRRFSDRTSGRVVSGRRGDLVGDDPVVEGPGSSRRDRFNTLTGGKKGLRANLTESWPEAKSVALACNEQGLIRLPRWAEPHRETARVPVASLGRRSRSGCPAGRGDTPSRSQASRPTKRPQADTESR
jgi:hypothetical protein